MRYFFILLLFSTKINAQSSCDCFDRLHNLSVHYSFVKDWQMAINTLKDGMSYLDEHQCSSCYYELAEYYNNAQKPDSATYYFTKAIENGYPAQWVKDNYPVVFKKIDSDLVVRCSILFRKKINFSLYDSFVTTLAIDQSLRDGTLFSENDIFHSASERKNFIDTMFKRVDNFDYNFLSDILEKYQYPSEYQLGFYPSGLMALILHVTANNNSESDSIIHKLEFLNQSCSFPQKSIILFLKDRQRLYTEGKSCCGVSGSDAVRYTSIEDVDKADSIRFLFNQIRLKEELSQNDSTSVKLKIQLDSRGYKPTSYPKNYFCNGKYSFE